MIELVDVTKKFGNSVAVDSLSLTVERGELFAFLGPNGAGKTTTIKMICGLLVPSSGRVLVGGYDVVSDDRRSRQLIGYVPDEPYLYEKLSGREFLQFVADMYCLEPAEGKRRMDELIEVFEMASYIDRLTETYSHGMKQRVVLSASLMRRPPVLVVDEPMVGLDPRSSRLVKDLLKAHAAEGAVVFMSTHTLAVAEEVADRIAIIDRGRLVCQGTLEQLRSGMSQLPLEELFLQITHESSHGQVV